MSDKNSNQDRSDDNEMISQNIAELEAKEIDLVCENSVLIETSKLI